MITALVMVDNADSGVMVCTPAPAMLNAMRSALVPLAELFAAMIASRSDTKPSAPLLASSVLRLVVSPSAVSATVSTVIVACVLDTAAMLRANSDVSVKVVKVALLLVAVALINSPTATEALTVVLIVTLPAASVATLAEPR